MCYQPTYISINCWRFLCGRLGSCGSTAAGFVIGSKQGLVGYSKLKIKGVCFGELFHKVVIRFICDLYRRIKDYQFLK